MKRNKTLVVVGALCLALALLGGVFAILYLSTPRLTLEIVGDGSVFGGASQPMAEGTYTLTATDASYRLHTHSGSPAWTLDGTLLGHFWEMEIPVMNTNMNLRVDFTDKQAKLDPYTSDVVVYQAEETGSSASRPFFPTVTEAADGTILVAYYYANGHALYNQSEGKLSGVLCLVRSTDGGKTFSEPETLVDLRDEDRAKGDFNREPRDPNLQRLSDGTLLLTFPVRAPIGKAGYNGSNLNDYWSERSYYMTSIDNGATWSEMREIECDYFSGGEPFLYDDPERTTGCWVKNGSAAELEGGELLLPLYGAKTCESRADYTGVCVKAKNNGDGTLTFVKDWATIDGVKTDASLILPKGQGNEVALTASGDVVYALARTAIPSTTKGGVLYRSTDGGVTFSEHALEPTGNDCLNQPNFCQISGDYVLANYSVPLASVYNSPARRTARPVYAKLFNVKTGDWDEFEAVCLYDSTTSTVADMGNPSSVRLSDGRIFTVFYDTGAPATRRGFIGGRFTDASTYLSETPKAHRIASLLAE
ncbi:MAG: exo-alpha-sialidase [Clostridia bacterium]|nr:exo-alpha-sialidase [Clostridia bacterium]